LAEPLSHGWRISLDAPECAVLYGDIASMFFQVDTVTTFGEPYADDSVRDEAFMRLTRSLDFEAEEHLETNRDVFMELDERPATKHLYHLLHQIIDEGPAHMQRNCNRMQWRLGKYIRDGTLHGRYFRKSLPKNQADRLTKRATEIYDESI
jgi:hypothetical protein